MSITKEYTDEAKINTFLNKTITVGSADDAINQAVDVIDQLTGRNFIADSEASSRLFDGNDKDILPIDECVEITVVQKGDNYYGDSFTTIAEFVQGTNSAGYSKMPFNFSALKAPIRRLALRGYAWLLGRGNHKITAKWGYSVAVPEAIVLATTILASGIYMFNRGGASGNVKSEKIGLYSVSYNNDEGWSAFERAKLAIAQYTKPII